MERNEKRCFVYQGAVKRFDRVITSNWSGKTWAVTEKKARNNLTYQFKKAMGFSPDTPITLLDDVKAV